MKHYTLIAVMAAVVLGTGCATTKYNPFRVGKEEIRSSVKTMALATLEAPSDLPDSKEMRADFETLLTTELQTAGFEVVPSKEYEEVFTRMQGQMGGFFDPMTGKADKERLKQVQDLCRREVAAKFHADAVLYPGLFVVQARLIQQVAYWDGVKETAIAGNWAERLLSGNYLGSLPALSLWITLKDTSGADLYVNGGGLQLIGKVKGLGGRVIEVPPQELLVDYQQKSRAVEIAIKPLREGEK